MDEHNRGRHFLTTVVTRQGDYKENKSKLGRVIYREISTKVFHVIFECYILRWGCHRIWRVSVDEAFVNVTALVE